MATETINTRMEQVQPSAYRKVSSYEFQLRYEYILQGAEIMVNASQNSNTDLQRLCRDLIRTTVVVRIQ